MKSETLSTLLSVMIFALVVVVASPAFSAEPALLIMSTPNPFSCN